MLYCYPPTLILPGGTSSTPTSSSRLSCYCLLPPATAHRYQFYAYFLKSFILARSKIYADVLDPGEGWGGDPGEGWGGGPGEGWGGGLVRGGGGPWPVHEGIGKWKLIQLVAWL